MLFKKSLIIIPFYHITVQSVGTLSSSLLLFPGLWKERRSVGLFVWVT